MIVVCINNYDGKLKHSLTVGKIYKVEYITDFGIHLDSYGLPEYIQYLIIDDDDVMRYYPKDCFITQEEHRDKKLENLGI